MKRVRLGTPVDLYMVTHAGWPMAWRLITTSVSEANEMAAKNQSLVVVPIRLSERRWRKYEKRT